jgi:putative oxidoreductase
MVTKNNVNPAVCPNPRTRLVDLGLFGLRAVAGGLMVGHGAQKLFGAFDGPGIEGMGKQLESMGMKPGKLWATASGMAEFGGGVLTALGLANPIGPIVYQASMAAAARTIHRDKPIWTTKGGPEEPILYSAIGLAVALAGPGRFSFDNVFGTHVPKKVVALTAIGAAGTVAYAVRQSQIAASKLAQASVESASSEVGEDRIVETGTSVETAAEPIDEVEEPLAALVEEPFTKAAPGV